MSEGITCWYVEYGNDRPIETTCKQFGWPHYDADGRRMYENSHFLALDDAWAALLANCYAAVQLGDHTREQALAALERATKELADAAHILAMAQRAHEAYTGRSK